jgi:hypothetical protein
MKIFCSFADAKQQEPLIFLRLLQLINCWIIDFKYVNYICCFRLTYNISYFLNDLVITLSEYQSYRTSLIAFIKNFEHHPKNSENGTNQENCSKVNWWKGSSQTTPLPKVHGVADPKVAFPAIDP